MNPAHEFKNVSALHDLLEIVAGMADDHRHDRRERRAVEVCRKVRRAADQVQFMAGESGLTPADRRTLRFMVELDNQLKSF